MLFTDNKDPVLCNKPTVSQCGRNATLNQSTNVVVIVVVVVVTVVVIYSEHVIKYKMYGCKFELVTVSVCISH